MYDLAILLLGVYPKDMKSLSQRDICTPMFTAALFIIVKTWKQPMYLSMDDGYNRIYIMEYYSVIKRRKTCHL